MRKRICFTVLFLILSLVEVGCGDNRHPEDPSQTEKADTASKAGALGYGYFFEEDGIVVSSAERFLYSDWEPVYQDRLIILHACSQFVDNESTEKVWDYSIMYQTDVYEADPDGSNRRKVAAFSGAIDSPSIIDAAVLAEGKLYFGGVTEVRNRIGQDILGGEATNRTWASTAIYCLDLNDYTVETFAVTENKEGTPTYLHQFYEYDGMIYGIISYFQTLQIDSAVWCRIDPVTGVYEEILRFDSNAARFCGAIGDTVYYWYENSAKTLCAKDISEGAKEREIMTVTGENTFINPFILDRRILIMTDRRMEGKEHMAEYTVLDPEGKVLDTIRYDAYITFLDVVGDKILYFELATDSDWEICWANKEDLADLPKKGVRIGPLNGSALDRLVD